jgi:hypothetical protein
MTFPSSPTDAQQATVNGITYQYNAARNSWKIVTNTQIATIASQAFAQANSAVKLTTSETKPLQPRVGDRWYNSQSDITYEYTSVGTTAFWIDVSSPTISTQSSAVNSTKAAGYALVFGA